MKTFDQCKANEIIQKVIGPHVVFRIDGDITSSGLTANHIKEAMELYAQEVAKDAWERACEAMRDKILDRWIYMDVSILNKIESTPKPTFQPNQ